MENISFTDRVKSEDVLNRVDETRNILQTVRISSTLISNLMH